MNTTCDTCDGSGKCWYSIEYNVRGIIQKVEKFGTCPTCGGTGKDNEKVMYQKGMEKEE